MVIFVGKENSYEKSNEYRGVNEYKEVRIKCHPEFISGSPLFVILSLRRRRENLNQCCHSEGFVRNP